MVLAGILTIGVGLRLWNLSSVASPWEDEGNWTLLSLRLTRGEPAELEPEARFVPRTFGYLIACTFTIFGPSFHSARLVVALGPIVGACVIALTSRTWKSVYWGVAVSCFLMVHPWSVFWGRTAGVPYTLTLTLGILAPLAWLTALQVQTGWMRCVCLLGAGQFLVLGLHFSPLFATTILACAVWTVLFRASELKTWGPWLAAVCMVLHAWPIITLGMNVASILSETPLEQPVFNKLQRYAMMVVDMLTGEATVRHFTDVSYRGTILWATRGFMAFGLLASLFNLGYVSRNQFDPENARGDPVRGLGKLGAVNLLLSLVLVPIILGVGRDWSFYTIDADRYGFALLAPAIVTLSSLSTGKRGSRWLLGMLVFSFTVLPSCRALNALAEGGGPEKGYFNFDGGGWRFFRRTAEKESLPDRLWDIVRREADQESLVILIDEQATLRPLEFYRELEHNREIGLMGIPRTRDGHFFWPELAKGTKVILAVWSDRMFASDYLPLAIPILNYSLRRDFAIRFDEVRLLETISQPDGAPLMELWTGRVRDEQALPVRIYRPPFLRP